MMGDKIALGILYSVAIFLLVKGIEDATLLIIAGIMVMGSSLLYTHWYTTRKRFQEHNCMNQWMEGSYQCEVCNPDP